MDIVVFDGWLETLGGAERQALAAAEALRALGTVTVVSHRAVGARVVGERLGVDVTGFRWVRRPEASSAARTFAGLACDLFVNATHHSRFVMRDVPSIGFVYFPPRPGGLRYVARRVLGSAVGSALEGPRTGVGWFGPEGTGRSWYQQSDGAGSLFVRPGARLRLWLADLAARDDAPGSSYRVTTSGGEVVVRGKAPSGGDFEPSDWFVVPEGVSSLVLESAGRVVTRSGERRVLGLALGVVEEGGRPLRSVPGRVSRLLFWSQRRWVVESGFTDYGGIYRSYDEVTANSRYTAQWLKRWWGVEAEVIEPPVIANTQVASWESPLILSIGRFFAGGHNKKHVLMVRAFRRLVEGGLTGWRLALVGGLGQQPADRAYFEAVRQAASGLPVDLYVDADEALVTKLRARATLCWHAAGFGEPPTRHPERYEHFGMAVAEMMGAGVVPIVLDGGGLREIVRHGETGLRWRTLDELAQHTLRLARDARLRRRLAEAGRERATRWSLEIYQRRVVDLAKRAYARRAGPQETSSSRSARAR